MRGWRWFLPPGDHDHPGEDVPIDVAPAQDGRNAASGEIVALLPRGRDGRGARAFGHVVRRGEDEAHGFLHLVIGDFDDARGVREDGFQRGLVGHATREAVGDASAHRALDGFLVFEGPCVCRGFDGTHADDLRGKPQCFAGGDRAADAAAEPDGHVQDIDVRHGVQQFERIARDAPHEKRVEGRDHVQSVRLGQGHGVFACCLEVLAVLHELRAERAHGVVLLAAVAYGDHDRGRDLVLAGGKGDRLPVVAARRADHALRLRAIREFVEVHQAAAQLERADRRVVLVLEPDLGAQARCERRPQVLRRGLHVAVDEVGGFLELVEGGEAHGTGTGKSGAVV